jgi:OOP family OmpA-OmpF porin
MTRFKRDARATLLAAAVLASPALHAQDSAVNSGLYMGIHAGESKAHFDDARIGQAVLGSGVALDTLATDQKSTGYKAYVGFPINPNWALETGYFDLGRFGFDAGTSPAGTVAGSLRIKGLNVDVVGTLPITDRWSLLGRVGAAYAQTKGSFTGTGAGAVADSTTEKKETNFKYGLGTQYAFTPALTLRLEGERYRINDSVGRRAHVDLVSLGLVYRFGGPTPATKTAYTPYVAPPAPAFVPVEKVPLAVAKAPATAATAAVVTPAVVPVPVSVAMPVQKPWVKVKLAADTLFGFDQASLQSDGQQALDKLLLELKDVNVEAVQITGHTDRLGAKAYNDKLSTRRAEAVRNYLVQVGGMSASKVTATGMGSSQPESATNDCKGMKASQALITCLRVDRRVDVDVMGSQQSR